MSTWSLFIKDDVIERITAGEPLPFRLTLHSMADHYEVSITPVRQAICELVDEGYLEKQGNGRLAVNNKRSESEKKPAYRKQSIPPKDRFEEICDDVVLVCLKGEAVFLREEDTAQKYGISGTGIRQVFSRLAGSGIIEHVPRRGWRVRPFRQEQLVQFSQVRKVLELETLRLAWPKLVDADLQKMRDENVLPRTDDEEPAINDEIHNYLIEKAGNEYIRDFMDRHMRFFRVLFTWEGHNRQAAIETVQGLWVLLDAMLRRDKAAAQKALTKHLEFDHALLKKINPHET